MSWDAWAVRGTRDVLHATDPLPWLPTAPVWPLSARSGDLRICGPGFEVFVCHGQGMRRAGAVPTLVLWLVLSHAQRRLCKGLNVWMQRRSATAAGTARQGNTIHEPFSLLE